MDACECVNAFQAADAENTLAAPSVSVKPGSPVCSCRLENRLAKARAALSKKPAKP
jgi:hypothetical protein